MCEAERRRLAYLFKPRLTAGVKRVLQRAMQQTDWQNAGARLAGQVGRGAAYFFDWMAEKFTSAEAPTAMIGRRRASAADNLEGRLGQAPSKLNGQSDSAPPLL